MNPVTHWWVQRLTSVAMIPLGIWLIWAAVRVAGVDYANAVAFISNPFNALAAIATGVIALYHAALGIEVIIEDYVPGERLPSLLLTLVRLACGLMVLAVVALVVNVALAA